MKKFAWFFVILLLAPMMCQAQSISNPPTTRVPLCLQYPDKKVYVPCTGVVAVDPDTGNPQPWSDVFHGSPSSPSYVQETARRMHWTETKTPLASNAKFDGTIHDDTSSGNGGTTRWNVFSCFVMADQSGTLNLQTSDDGVNWISPQSRPIVPNTSLYLVQPIVAKYSRCQVINGDVAQGSQILFAAFGNS